MTTEFHLKEYEAIRAEILMKKNAANETLRFMILANAGAMSWIISNSASYATMLLIAVAWIPLIITLLSAFFHFFAVASINRLGRYIFQLETRYADEGQGWQHYARSLHKKGLITSAGPAYILAVGLAAIFGLAISAQALGFIPSTGEFATYISKLITGRPT